MRHSKAIFVYIFFLTLIISPVTDTNATEGNTKPPTAKDLPLGVSVTKKSAHQKGWFDGYTFMPSIMSKNSNFTYKEVDRGYQSYDHPRYGTLIEENYLAPGLRFRSPILYKYPGHRWFNADTFLEIAFSTFETSKQRIQSESGYTTEDLGTSVYGKYLDVAYVAYIQLLDTFFITDKIHALRFGIGAGIRYFTAKGNIILTDPNIGERRLVDINTAETKFLGKAIIEYQYDNFLLTIGRSGTGLPFSYEQYNYSESTVEIAYIFNF